MLGGWRCNHYTQLFWVVCLFEIGSYYTGQTGFKLRDPSASASQVLGSSLFLKQRSLHIPDWPWIWDPLPPFFSYDGIKATATMLGYIVLREFALESLEGT